MTRTEEATWGLGTPRHGDGAVWWLVSVWDFAAEGFSKLNVPLEPVAGELSPQGQEKAHQLPSAAAPPWALEGAVAALGNGTTALAEGGSEPPSLLS